MPFLPRLLRPIARSGFALLLGTGLVLGSTGVAPAQASPRLASESLTGISESLVQASITLAPSQAILLPSENRFEFSVHMQNTGDVELPAGNLRLELHPQRLNNTMQLQDILPDDGVVISETEIGVLGAGADHTAAISVRSEDFPLTALDDPGVYMLQVTFSSVAAHEASTLSDASPFIWRSAAVRDATDPATPSGPDDAAGGSATADAVATSGAAQLGLIIPLVLPSAVQSMPTRAQLDKAIPELEALIDLAKKSRATLAIDPRIIAGIRAFGDDASTQSQQFLTKLETTNLPTFQLQFADADPAAQSAIGLTELLKPSSLDFVSRHGSFPETAPDDPAETELPSDTDNSEDAAIESDEDIELPALEELLSWPEGDGQISWPAEGQVDAGTIKLLENSGYTDTIVTTENVTHEGGPRAQMGSGRALIVDADLGAAVRGALTASNETVRLADSTSASAILALTAQSENPEILLGLDRGAIANTPGAAEILGQLFAPTWVEPTAVSSLSEGNATLRSAAPLEERRELLRSAVGRESSVNEVSALLQHPIDLTGYQRTRLLDLFATRYAAPTARFSKVAEKFLNRDAELREGVSTVDTEHTQLVGTSTRIPLQLHNHLPFDALVTVRVLPISAALSIGDREFSEVAIAPEGNARVLVPVRSRVSSGESAISIEVSDASGEFISDTGTLPLTIRSSIETIGLWSLGILAALLFGFGTVRSLRRRRKRLLKLAAASEEANSSPISASPQIEE